MYDGRACAGFAVPRRGVPVVASPHVEPPPPPPPAVPLTTTPRPAPGAAPASPLPVMAINGDAPGPDGNIVLTLERLSGGTIDPGLLPASVHDILEFSSFESFPSPGALGRLYVARDTGALYRWTGAAYVLAAYLKPASGIPAADLSESVRDSLAAADSALQAHQSLADYYTKSEVDNLVASATPGDYDSLKGRVSAAEGKIPSAASSSNQLADKAYVGTEISSAISAVTDGAPEAFDTLKEIADWIGDEGSGAQRVIDQVANKVDKVEGKGLSTNDFTTAEKEKLAGIAPGATAVTVDSALSGSSANPVENRAVKAAFDERPTKADIESGWASDEWTFAGTPASDGYHYEVVRTTPPSPQWLLYLVKDGQTANDSGVPPLSANNDFPSDATTVVFESVTATRRRVAGPTPTKTSDLQNDGDGTSPFAKVSQLPTVPTSVSAFENDAGYVTEEELTEAVVGAIDDAGPMDNAKADKYIPAAAGNLASLAADGNLMDSGKKPSDFAPATNIQKSALASDVQASLGLADSALQVHQELVYEDGSWHADSLLDDEEHDVRVVEVVSGPTYHDGNWTAQFLYNNGVTQQLSASGAEDATELKFGPNGTTAVFSRVPAGYVLREATRSRSRSAAESAKVQPAGFYADRSEMAVTAGTGDDADKTTIQLKEGVSATVLTAHQDISGKADASDVETALAGKADNSDVSDLRDYVDGLFNYKAITASLSITASSPSLGSGESQTVREKGRTVTAATFHYVFNKVPVEAKFGTANPPTEAVDNPALSGDIAKTGMLVTSATTWRISGKEAEVAGKTQQTATASATINFYNGVYYGVAAIPGTLDSAFILGLANKSLRSGKLTSFTVNAGAGQYIWYALPESMGACAFKVGGFDGGFTLADTIQFTNSVGHAESYRVYRSDNPSLGSTTVNVS